MTILKDQWYDNRQSGYTHRYHIEYRREADGTISVWALDHPPDPHDKGVSHHHLFETGQLCVRSGREFRDVEKAEAFAYWWMERFSVYSSTGSFPMTPGTVRTPDR